MTFSVEGGAQLLGESPISAEARIATILLNTGSRGGWLRIRAQAGELAGQLSTAARKAVRPM